MFALTPERFAAGRSFDQYLDYVSSAENLRREASEHHVRTDRGSAVRAWYESTGLSEYQAEALRWLAQQPNGPAKVLVIAEEWSSDCRRDVPMLAHMAEAAGLELRIFNRDGDRFSGAPEPSPDESPNADLMAAFLNRKNGRTWQSVPVAAFYTKDFEYLYHYMEYPAIYEKDRIVYGHIRVQRPGETPEGSQARGEAEFMQLVASPFFRVWADAAVDEMISALHRRVVLGSV